MSEYQYYEFQAVDRPLSEADRLMLRKLSTRGRITATSFVNAYEWGDLKGEPLRLVEQCFDLHLYLANWGSRRLIMRLPARLADRRILDALLAGSECATLSAAGGHLILDIRRDELEFDDWDDGSGWLAALAPLRADVLGGDLRLFYLLWLAATEGEAVDDAQPEPLPGLGPMSAPLEAFADFFAIDQDLVQAAAERPCAQTERLATPQAARAIISAMPDAIKTALLARLFDGDSHVRAELKAEIGRRLAKRAASPAPAPRRTLGELRARAEAIGAAREATAAEARAAEDAARAEHAERARRDRLLAVARRGEGVWRDVEVEIERRSSAGYDKAAGLLADLRAVADERGATEEFSVRLRALGERHARKERFIERLTGLRLHAAA